MINKQLRSFAPATVANVTCGFDILGFAIELPGDEIEIQLTNNPGIKILSINGDNNKLPLDPDLNSASVAIQNYLNHIKNNVGVNLIINKKMPISSGMGSSAASAVAAVYGINTILDSPLKKEELLQFAIEGEKIACGSAHADNVAASLLGGFILIRSYDPLDVISINYPDDLVSVVIHPELEINTKLARKLIKTEINLKDAISQWGNVAGLISGLHQKDYNLISRSLIDNIAEPNRSKLIIGFDDVKQAALNAGALGCGISGSGPSMFALCNNIKIANTIAASMIFAFKKHNILSKSYISKINSDGAIILNK